MDFNKFIILIVSFSDSFGMRYCVQIEDGLILVQFSEVSGCNYNKIVCDFVKCIDAFPCLLSSYFFIDDVLNFKLLFRLSEDK